MLCCSHEREEASTLLLRSPQSQSPDESTAEWQFQKLKFLGQDGKMGHGTIGEHRRFQEEKRHQITSPGRFYRRLDRAIKLHRRRSG
jgi:hypothetical protein